MLNDEEALKALKELTDKEKLPELVATFDPALLCSYPAFALQAVSIVPEIFPFLHVKDFRFLDKAIAISPYVAQAVEEAMQPLLDQFESELELSECCIDDNRKNSILRGEGLKNFDDILSLLNYQAGQSPYANTVFFQAKINAFLLEWFRQYHFRIDDRSYIQSVCNITRFFFPIALADEKIRKDDEIAQELIQRTDGLVLPFLSKDYSQNDSYIYGWIRFFPDCFPFLSSEQRNDISLAAEAICNRPEYFAFVGEQIRKDAWLVRHLIEKNPDIYDFLPKEFQNNVGLAIAAIEEDPGLYYRLSDEVKGDEDLLAAFAKRQEKGMWRFHELVDPPPRPFFCKVH